MTEHVHYWCDPHIFPSREQNYWVCHYEGCDERLTFKEAEARLNENETLKAATDDAFRELQVAPTTNNYEFELWRLDWCKAYANTLEGKDE